MVTRRWCVATWAEPIRLTANRIRKSQKPSHLLAESGGIVADARQQLAEPARATAYIPFRQRTNRGIRELRDQDIASAIGRGECGAAGRARRTANSPSRGYAPSTRHLPGRWRSSGYHAACEPVRRTRAGARGGWRVRSGQPCGGLAPAGAGRRSPSVRRTAIS